MAEVIYSQRALDDLVRLVGFLREEIPQESERVARRILEVLTMLADHPLLGRAADPLLREVVISRGRTGYVALYEGREADDVVIVHAIRHQREAGYGGE